MTLCTCCSHIWRDNGNGHSEPSHNPAVARWTHSNGNMSLLCLDCLNCWFDNADDDEELEPAAWSWLPMARPQSTPDAEDIAEWLRAPTNQHVVTELLRRELRSGAPWLRDHIAREVRASRLDPVPR